MRFSLEIILYGSYVPVDIFLSNDSFKKNALPIQKGNRKLVSLLRDRRHHSWLEHLALSHTPCCSLNLAC